MSLEHHIEFRKVIVKNNLRHLRSDPHSVKGFGEWKIASPWLRVTAQIIDQGLVSFAVISAMSIWFPQKIGTARWISALILLWIVVSTVTQFVFIWFYGNSPGKRSLGLILQSAKPQGGHLTTPQVIVRSFTWWLGLLTLGAGWATIFSRSDRRAWHDVAADTVVISNTLDPQYPTLFERKLGEIWLGILSVTFMVIVLSLLMLQMQTLRRLTHETGYRRFDQLPYLDQQSWLVVAGETLKAPQDLLIGDEAGLSKLLIRFSHGYQLPFPERYSFYKSQMEDLEDQLCRSGHEKMRACQSARLMVELLTPEPNQDVYPFALEGLKTLQQIGSRKGLIEKSKALNSELQKMPLFSPQYLALKSEGARILLRTGDIKRAEAYMSEDFQRLKKSESPKNNPLEKVFEQMACQVSSLNDCEFKSMNLCLEDKFWQDWQKGCKTKDLPTQFESKSEMLGFWWKKSSQSKIYDLSYAKWTASKAKFLSKESENSTFEQNVALALDFVINLKTSPKDIIVKERKLSPESVLWGWAQTQALQTLGQQWSFIVYPIEKKMMEEFNIIPERATRTPASEMSYDKKPRLTPQLTIER